MDKFASDRGFLRGLQPKLRTSQSGLSRNYSTFDYATSLEGVNTPHLGHAYSSCAFVDEGEEDHGHGIVDTMEYRTSVLTTWELLTISYEIVWTSSTLWIMMFQLGMVSFFTFAITVLVVPNPSAMKVSKFTDVSKFLTIAVGLLLGLLLSMTMKRWHNAVAGFMSLLDSVRNMQMHLVSLGVPKEKALLGLRYCYASAYLLYGQLLADFSDEKRKDLDLMWEKLLQKVAYLDGSFKTKMLTEREVDILAKTRDPPGMIWIWVTAYIGRLSQDGWIPPMQSPTFSRIMDVCDSAHGGIRTVRAAISIEDPLIYTHMLATLTHINNILCALSFGLVAGIACGTWMMRYFSHFYRGVKELQDDAPATDLSVMRDWQSMAVSFLYSFVCPLVYQALLIVAMQLAQPFNHSVVRPPMDRLLHDLEADLCYGRDMTKHIKFKEARFKELPV